LEIEQRRKPTKRPGEVKADRRTANGTVCAFEGMQARCLARFGHRGALLCWSDWNPLHTAVSLISNELLLQLHSACAEERKTEWRRRGAYRRWGGALMKTATRAHLTLIFSSCAS